MLEVFILNESVETTLGNFNPSEIKSLVELVKEFGFQVETDGDIEVLEFESAYVDGINGRFEIVVK